MAALAGFFLPEVLAFTGALQGVSSVISYGDDVQNEINRQKSICDEIAKTQSRQTAIDAVLKEIQSDKGVQSSTDETLRGINDDIAASNNQILYIKKHYKQKLLVVIITNIFIVTLILLYIYFKASQ
jgi:hypothetical protein